jgi:exodeoxyribonuclease-5
MGIYRLRAKPWPGASIGLTPIERGMLVHAALAAFWREVREQSRLLAMSSLQRDETVARAVAQACTDLPVDRWQALPPAVAASEAGCIEALVGNGWSRSTACGRRSPSSTPR